MFNIDHYLKRFSKKINSIDFDKEKIVEVVNSFTKLNIKKEDIEVKDFKIYIKTSLVGKNQLFIYKNKLLEGIKSSTDNNFIDII